MAFSILCHGNLGQLEALFSTIFRPQNAYCIYVDDKSPIHYKKAVRQLAAIYKYHFPEARIYVPKETIRIYWSDVSILEAGLQCMELLTQPEVGDWQFFINTVGSALPGRPMQNITDEILQSLHGDVIASVPMTPMVKRYTEYKQRMPKNADRFNFDRFETNTSMYHNEFLPYRTAIKKEP